MINDLRLTLKTEIEGGLQMAEARWKQMFNRVVHGPAEERGVEPNRYVDWFGDPVGGRYNRLKRIYNSGLLWGAGLYLAGSMALGDQPAEKVLRDKLPFLPIPVLGAIIYRRSARMIIGSSVDRVIDTRPDPGVITQASDLVSAVAMQVGALGGFAGLAVSSAFVPPLGITLTGACLGGVSLKVGVTGHQVLRGKWVVVPRDQMKQKQENPVNRLKPALHNS